MLDSYNAHITYWESVLLNKMPALLYGLINTLCNDYASHTVLLTKHFTHLLHMSMQKTGMSVTVNQMKDVKYSTFLLAIPFGQDTYSLYSYFLCHESFKNASSKRTPLVKMLRANELHLSHKEPLKWSSCNETE